MARSPSSHLAVAPAPRLQHCVRGWVGLTIHQGPGRDLEDGRQRPATAGSRSGCQVPPWLWGQGLGLTVHFLPEADEASVFVVGTVLYRNLGSFLALQRWAAQGRWGGQDPSHRR